MASLSKIGYWANGRSWAAAVPMRCFAVFPTRRTVGVESSCLSAHSVLFTEDMSSLPFTSSCLLWLQVCCQFSYGTQSDSNLLRGEKVKHTTEPNRDKEEAGDWNWRANVLWNPRLTEHMQLRWKEGYIIPTLCTVNHPCEAEKESVQSANPPLETHLKASFQSFSRWGICRAKRNDKWGNRCPWQAEWFDASEERVIPRRPKRTYPGQYFYF